MIKYIVDNKIFYNSRECISKFPTSKFYKIVIDGQMDLDTNRLFNREVNVNPIMIIDTDADVFQHIISYMRFPDIQININDNYLYNKIKYIASYFELDGLVKMLGSDIDRGQFLLESMLNINNDNNNDTSPYTFSTKFDVDNVSTCNMDNLFNINNNINNGINAININNNDNDDTSSVDSAGYDLDDFHKSPTTYSKEYELDDFHKSPTNEHRELTTEMSLTNPAEMTPNTFVTSDLYNIVDTHTSTNKKKKIINNYVSI